MDFSSASSLQDVAATFVGYINLIIPVLGAAALVLFLWSGVQYIYKAGDTHGKGAQREALIWGLIALFVLVSVWGIVRVVCSTIVGDSSCQTEGNAKSDAYSP